MKFQMKDILSIIKIILCIITLTIVECSALVFVAMIPKDSIKQHANESADILLNNDVFFYLNQEDHASRIDRYADSILLNIAYSYDEQHPFKSIMLSSYYYEATQNENYNLKETITQSKSPNRDYIRYWHGSNLIVKPLLLLTNINGIYMINTIIIMILLIVVLNLLWKRIGKTVALCMLISCVAVSLWYVPFSLEYTWNIIIMLIALILSIHMYAKKQTNFIYFFIIIGNLTAYFDFLSTETLTFTLPLICILLLQNKNNPFSTKMDYLKTTLQTGISWLIGYGSAWISKWTITSVVLQTNAFQLALQQASTRISGEAANISITKQTTGAITRNIVCLFPFNYLKENALFVFIITISIIFIFYYLFKKQNHTSLSTILCIIALVPYIRFSVLSNHSYLHYFFTYRAQLASIFAFGLAIIYGTDTTLLKKEWSKLCKKKT